MFIYKHTVSLAPKQFLVLPRFDLPMFRFMMRFGLCSRAFHSHMGGGHSEISGTQLPPLASRTHILGMPPTLGLYPILSIHGS